MSSPSVVVDSVDHSPVPVEVDSTQVSADLVNRLLTGGQYNPPYLLDPLPKPPPA